MDGSLVFHGEAEEVLDTIDTSTHTASHVFGSVRGVAPEVPLTETATVAPVVRFRAVIVWPVTVTGAKLTPLPHSTCNVSETSSNRSLETCGAVGRLSTFVEPELSSGDTSPYGFVAVTFTKYRPVLVGAVSAADADVVVTVAPHADTVQSE